MGVGEMTLEELKQGLNEIIYDNDFNRTLDLENIVGKQLRFLAESGARFPVEATEFDDPGNENLYAEPKVTYVSLKSIMEAEKKNG
jgi:hypothetical protein